MYDVLFFYQDNSANSLELTPNVAYVTNDFNATKVTPIYEEVDLTYVDAGSKIEESIEKTSHDDNISS